MAVKAGELESELIDAVCERIHERLPGDQAAPCERFVRQYYHWVPAEDLADRGQSDLYSAAIAHWNFARERAPGEAKVRVYNPDSERDGWESPYTVVEIVSDDMPFIVDSVTMELAHQDFTINLMIHPVVRVRRDGAGLLVDVLDPGEEAEDSIAESVFRAEVLREHDRDALTRLRAGIERVLGDVRAAVEDWPAMRDRALELVEELEQQQLLIDPRERSEVRAFLRWVAEDHFTFLGYREYALAADEARLTVLPDTGLGILRGTPASASKRLSKKGLPLARSEHPLVLTKANSRSTVHRPAYLDYIGVKRFGADGQVTGERRFLGLYTTGAYRESAREIPLLRGKVEKVLERAGFPAASHDSKALVEILESYPRDVLFQIDVNGLFEIAMGLLALGERPRVRLFVWEDPLDRFVSCLVTIPRDRYHTENRERVGNILREAFGGEQLDWSLQLSESVLARVHYIVRCPKGAPGDYDTREIEERLVQATRAWSDELREALISKRGDEQGATLFKRYLRAFPPAYSSDWSAQAAVAEIEKLEQLPDRGGSIIALYRPPDTQDGTIRCKLYSSRSVLLSDVLPTFEHMGARVVDERPYRISPRDRDPVWIYDFGLRCAAEDIERVADLFQEAFLAARRGEIEDDRLNGLVLRAAMTGREITVLRAAARYLRQGGVAYSDAYMERTLLAHHDIARLLVEMFKARFDPDGPNPELGEHLHRAMEMAIDSVPSLDEDRILRSFLSVGRAILRTNYFRSGGAGEPPPYLSLKLDPSRVGVLPRPLPRFEIFVYSPRFEGVHLRGGKVARGGIRWSERPEDFRSEILGLMKAQMVKNALIVPVGAKGGFVLKRPLAGDGEALREEAVECYRMFLAGLLEVTDNIAGDDVVPPERLVRYDEDDPYLVVAPDKGTAAFSDIANQVSARYGFWLGDAFASGGSRGYDHRKMGITARGAWESVKRHFRELGTNIGTTDFTVAGIGDMSGDVFGNGMLSSPHIKLVAAFDHRHVFLDPNPDPEASLAERRRLFGLEGSAWSDYAEPLISEGGGVYERTAKSISLSAPARETLGIEAEELPPEEVIQAILKAPVDLLWNGGIGTYVKASDESHLDVSDKPNDAVRVDGCQLRCRVVGEGGNLGFTQRGRIEYAIHGGPEGSGGQINTDSIDNVAGVNTSDHEVNIKILLDSLVAGEEISEEQRNALLVEMTDAVAERVLYASYTQTQAISLGLAQAAPMIDVHARLIRQLEEVAGLDISLESLPGDEAIEQREAQERGLTAPELAIVMAYSKIYLYARLLESDLPEDDYLRHDLERYFPAPLPERYGEQMLGHRLRREIIATTVANQLVDRTGTTFAFRLGEETGATPALLARGYAVAREVFDMRAFWTAVEALDNQVDAHTQLAMLIEGRRLVERATRWLVRAHPSSIDIAEALERFQPGAKLLTAALPDVLAGTERESYDARRSQLDAEGVPAELATRVAAMPSLLPTFDIVEVADGTGRDQQAVMATYFALASRLELTWLRDRILELPRANRWQALTRAALRDDLFTVQRALTREVLEASEGSSSDAALEEWARHNEAALARYLGTLADIRATRSYDTTTLPVALREVRSLVREGELS